MTPSRFRIEKHGGKLALLFWVCLLVGTVAAAEWKLAPEGERHRARKIMGGGGLARSLALREWKPNTDYSFPAPENRKTFPGGDSDGLYKVATDENGFIQPAQRHKRPDRSIVILGGSTTECLYVTPDKRFPSLVAQKLEAATGLKVNGLNGGRSGNNVMHSLLLLMGKVIPLAPDYVVLMHATNDLAILSTAPSYWQPRRSSLRLFTQEKVSVVEGLEIIGRALAPYPLEAVLRARRRLWQLFRTNQAKAWGITPVLMTQVKVRPATEAARRTDFFATQPLGRANLDVQDVSELHSAFNTVLRQVAESEGALLIDLAASRSWDTGELYDGLHFTDLGSERVAEIIAKALEKQIR